MERLAHRGPDGSGELSDGRVWLGHTRLAVIDLSDEAAQPMRSSAYGSSVFNGEIYDHERHRNTLRADGAFLHTKSDTEVLLAGLSRHGVEFLTRLHGMFAFAWLEPGGRSLWLARDHAGIKPLYVAETPAGIAFASELRAIAPLVAGLTGSRPSLSIDALAGFLGWGSVPEPDTVLEGVSMVPAATAMRVDVNTGRVVERRSLAWPAAAVHSDDCSRVAAVQEAVRNAVRRHLVADTPVAIFLSSGIDSGILAQEASNNSRCDVTAITVRLGSAGTADEVEIARRLCSRLGLTHRVIEAEEWRQCLEKAWDAYDQPSIDGLNTYVISAVARHLGFKVALSGVGADEVFGGYGHLSRRGLRRVNRVARPALRAIGAHLVRAGGTRVGRAGVICGSLGEGETYQRARRRLFTAEVTRALLARKTTTTTGLPGNPLLAEQTTYLRNTLLRDSDVMGMWHGVEIRAPFLDPEVLATAEACGPDALLNRKRPRKWILKRGWRELLDANTLTRRKTGFSLDTAAWLQGQGREFSLDLLAGLDRRSCIDRNELARVRRRAIAALDDGHPAAAVPTLALMHLEWQFRRWSAS